MKHQALLEMVLDKLLMDWHFPKYNPDHSPNHLPSTATQDFPTAQKTSILYFSFRSVDVAYKK